MLTIFKPFVVFIFIILAVKDNAITGGKTFPLVKIRQEETKITKEKGGKSFMIKVKNTYKASMNSSDQNSKSKSDSKSDLAYNSIEECINDKNEDFPNVSEFIHEQNIEMNQARAKISEERKNFHKVAKKKSIKKNRDWSESEEDEGLYSECSFSNTKFHDMEKEYSYSFNFYSSSDEEESDSPVVFQNLVYHGPSLEELKKQIQEKKKKEAEQLEINVWIQKLLDQQHKN